MKYLLTAIKQKEESRFEEKIEKSIRKKIKKKLKNGFFLFIWCVGVVYTWIETNIWTLQEIIENIIYPENQGGFPVSDFWMER